MSGSRDSKGVFDGAVQKKLLDDDDVTTLRPLKLQNSKNGLQLFGKLIAPVFTANLFLHLSLF